VIPTQWDWAGYFEYGIARVCNNCHFDYSKDSEHPSLDLSKAQVYYIDKQGRQISSLENKQNNKDQLLDSLYFSYEFKYSNAEQQILTISLTMLFKHSVTIRMVPIIKLIYSFMLMPPENCIIYLISMARKRFCWTTG